MLAVIGLVYETIAGRLRRDDCGVVTPRGRVQGRRCCTRVGCPSPIATGSAAALPSLSRNRGAADGSMLESGGLGVGGDAEQSFWEDEAFEEASHNLAPRGSPGLGLMVRKHSKIKCPPRPQWSPPKVPFSFHHQFHSPSSAQVLDMPMLTCKDTVTPEPGRI